MNYFWRRRILLNGHSVYVVKVVFRQIVRPSLLGFGDVVYGRPLTLFVLCVFTKVRESLKEQNVPL